VLILQPGREHLCKPLAVNTRQFHLTYSVVIFPDEELYSIDYRYCHLYWWLQTEFELVNGLSDHSQVITTNNYYTVADFYTTNHTTLSLLCLLS
jgi:hypothetical protein